MPGLAPATRVGPDTRARREGPEGWKGNTMSMTGTEPRLTLHTPEDEIRAAARDFTGSWWVFAVAGVAWMVLAAIVLRFDVTSVAAVGGLLGVMFLVFAGDGAVLAVRPPTRSRG